MGLIKFLPYFIFVLMFIISALWIKKTKKLYSEGERTTGRIVDSMSKFVRSRFDSHYAIAPIVEFCAGKQTIRAVYRQYTDERKLKYMVGQQVDIIYIAKKPKDYLIVGDKLKIYGAYRLIILSEILGILYTILLLWRIIQ